MDDKYQQKYQQIILYTAETHVSTQQSLPNYTANLVEINVVELNRLFTSWLNINIREYLECTSDCCMYTSKDLSSRKESRTIA